MAVAKNQLVISNGAAGTYTAAIAGSLGIRTDLVIEAGQHVSIRGDGESEAAVSLSINHCCWCICPSVWVSCILILLMRCCRAKICLSTPLPWFLSMSVLKIWLFPLLVFSVNHDISCFLSLLFLLFSCFFFWRRRKFILKIPHQYGSRPHICFAQSKANEHSHHSRTNKRAKHNSVQQTNSCGLEAIWTYLD